MSEPRFTREALLKQAAIFQGGVFLLGLLIGGWNDLRWIELLRWEWADVVRGLLAVVPLALVLWISLVVPWAPFRSIRDVLVRVLGPSLAECSLVDLALLALLAGTSEEILFRGAIQNAVSGWGLIPALMFTNLLFGVCHAMTRAYFVIAAAAGLYLSWVAGFERPNLVPAMITHSVYDFLALCVVVREVERARHRAPPEEPPDAEIRGEIPEPDERDERER